MMANHLPRLRAAFHRFAAPAILRHVGRGTRISRHLGLSHIGLNATIGDGCTIGNSVHLGTAHAGAIIIGDGARIGTGCVLVAHRTVSIGARVALGEYATIRDQEPRFAPASGITGQGFRVASVVVDDHVFIGRGAYLGPGTHIRSGSIVAANSVVHGAFPPNVLIAGAPATVRRMIGPDGTRSPVPDNVHLMAGRPYRHPAPGGGHGRP